MIFATVGNHYQGFERLVKKMDEIASKIDEKVIMQIGNTKYKPMSADYFTFIDSFKEIERLNHDARVVVSHAGVGSILTAFKQCTPIIIVPRLKKFGEHIDDHQLEIAEAISADPQVVVVYDVDRLEEFIKSDIKFKVICNNNLLANSIKNYLNLYKP